MKLSPTIARRELASFFHSPIAYVCMALFLLVSGFLFAWYDFKPGQAAEMRHSFEWMVWVLVVIIPLLSMGLMAREWATGTIESLLTAPVSEVDVILGKFMGSLAFIGLLVVPTLLFPALLWIFSTEKFDLWLVLSGYLGICLVAAMFLAIGLLCSTMTREQVVAAVTCATALFLLTVMPWLLSQITTLAKPIRVLCEQTVSLRYSDFARGTMDTGHVVFFLLSTAGCLFVSVKVLESRRWN